MHKYKVGDILWFENNSEKTKCEVTELFHLVYKNKYPSYKIKFIEDRYTEGGFKIEKSISPECMLSEIL